MQFGRLSVQDIRIFLSLLPAFESETAQMMALVKEKGEKLLGGPFAKVYWCNFYELPFSEHLKAYLTALDFAEEVNEIGTAPNPVEAIAAKLETMDAEIDAAFDNASPEELEQFRDAAPVVLALVTSLYNSFRCLLSFGCYLNDLIAKAQAGDERSLLNAIRVDPTVVGCPTALAYISRAVLVSDSRFMAKLKAALNGKLQKREQGNFQKMRLVLQILFEAGAEQLTDEQLHELFVIQLRLYSSDSKAGDVKKNLRKFANQYMSLNATT